MRYLALVLSLILVGCSEEHKAKLAGSAGVECPGIPAVTPYESVTIHGVNMTSVDVEPDTVVYLTIYDETGQRIHVEEMETNRLLHLLRLEREMP